MKSNSTVLFIRGCVIQVFSNKSRLALTITGIVLAAVLFLLISIFVNTYTGSLYSEAYACSQDGVLITGGLSDKLVDNVNTVYGSYHVAEFLTPIISNTTSYAWNDMELSVMPVIIGTGAGLLDGPVYSVQGTQMMFESCIVDGRTIQSDDVINQRRVVVISELAEDVLFGGRSAVGKTIELSLTGQKSDAEPYVVIGVYKNSYDEEAVLATLEDCVSKAVLSMNLQINCYVPQSISAGQADDDNRTVQAITIATGNDVALKEQVRSYYSMVDSATVTYYETKVETIDEINSELITLMHILMVIMMLIAGLNLFNSMMFSIRERVGEIGIRKAVGANGFDIIRQFVFENLIISILGVAIASVIIIIGATVFQIVVNRYSVFTIDVVLTWKILLETTCYAILIGIIFSIIPAIIAAKTNIIDAIRFD